MNIIINVEAGGFCLSRKAIEALAALGHPAAAEELAKAPDTDAIEDYGATIERNDPFLLKVVHELGPEANGRFATLKIVSIPDDVAWQIESDGAGCEWVAEEHRVWD